MSVSAKEKQSVIALYNRVEAGAKEADKLMLEASRHPTATSEELARIHAVYLRVYQTFLELRKTLRERYPHSRVVTPYPWERR